MPDMTKESPLEDMELSVIQVHGFKCGTCGGRAVPVEGFGTECHEADCDGEYTAKTGNTYELTVSEQQLELYADSVIVD
mgnify:CR=1 FL=1